MKMDRMMLRTVFLLISLIGLVELAKISSTTTVKSIAKKTSPQGISKRISAGTRKIITTRVGVDGNPEQQCECTVFYLCDKDNVIETSTSGQSIDCDSGSVCCSIPLASLNPSDTPPTDPVISPSPPPPIDPVTPQQPIIETTTQSCMCVPFYQCMNPLSLTSGEGIINPRISDCKSPNVCCTLAHWNANIPEPPPTPSPTPYIPPSPTPTPYIPPYIPPVDPNIPNPLPSDPSECGIRRGGVTNRITGVQSQTETIFGEFPWMALILTSDVASDGTKTEYSFVCGASLISPKIILTAAHCVDEANIGSLKVRVGEYNTSRGLHEPAPHQDREVNGIYVHPQYNSKVLFNDLALLTVQEPFEFASHVSPICVPFISNQWSGNVYDPNSCLATGWGKDAFDGIYQTTLKKVDLTIIPRDRCQAELRTTRLGQYFQLDPSFLCAGGQPGTDTCRGDGGGPLVCALRSDPNRYVQVGIVSWGIGCGDAIPAVYASLEANTKWLSEQYNILYVFKKSP